MLKVGTTSFLIFWLSFFNAYADVTGKDLPTPTGTIDGVNGSSTGNPVLPGKSGTSDTGSTGNPVLPSKSGTSDKGASEQPMPGKSGKKEQSILPKKALPNGSGSGGEPVLPGKSGAGSGSGGQPSLPKMGQ
jgi:hypothetical protein